MTTTCEICGHVKSFHRPHGARPCFHGDCTCTAFVCSGNEELDEAEKIYQEAEQQAASMVRQRVVTKLAAAIIADVKADCRPPLPTSEQQVRAVLQTLSLRLDEASQALFVAAERLKKKGDALGASQVYAAAQRTQLASKVMA